ncbi:myrosinase 1-like isoform X2 [Pectinophora gossypiella]|nr:myrosinase 1-like isoform X2 [Pectinophora gossypiella]
MLRELGVDHYRFSISWPRVLPNGHINTINEKGLQYYDNLLDELIKYNIAAMVTMYHFDLPQRLQDLGGWTNPEIIQWFEDYARVLFDRYGHKVKYWITINQPDVCFDAYGGNKMAPAVDLKGTGDYVCVKNMMLAHARAYRLFEKEYKSRSEVNAKLGLSVSINWFDAPDYSTSENEELELYRAFSFGLYLHPIWSESGDFPPSVKKAVAKNSKAEGLSKSRLPELTAEEIKMLKKSADFIGMNHYTTFFVNKTESGVRSGLPYSFPDIEVHVSQSDKWLPSKSAWLKGVPYGLYKSLLYLNRVYNRPPIFITEHGWSTDPGLHDTSRINMMREYSRGLLFSLEDGTDLLGLTVWSLMDNIEWTAGTSERFGLYEVDFDSPEKTRIPRVSAHYYKHMIHSRIVDEDWKLKNLDMSISNRRQKILANKKTEL